MWFCRGGDGCNGDKCCHYGGGNRDVEKPQHLPSSPASPSLEFLVMVVMVMVLVMLAGVILVTSSINSIINTNTTNIKQSISMGNNPETRVQFVLVLLRHHYRETSIDR